MVDDREQGEDAAIWAELGPLMADGPDRPVVARGRIISLTGTAGVAPVVTGVWLDGPKVRLEGADGAPSLISDGARTWSFDSPGAPVPVRSDERERSNGNGTELAFRRTATDIELFGFGTPAGPIERTDWLGRPAWAFAFEPPPHKPAPRHVVVDAATGLVMHQHFADQLRRDEWTEFTEVPALPPALFVWSGPDRSVAEVRAEHDAEEEADLAGRAQWFREHVTALPLEVRGLVTVQVNDWSADGRFFATLSGAVDGGLTRRPRSIAAWPTGMRVDHRWSDDTWDWAVSSWPVELSPGELDQLQRQLGSRPLAD